MSEKSFNDLELEVLEFWRKQNIFKKSVKSREDCPLFIFNDGPPFATGLPHYGHLLASTIKDTILRYKTMQGFYVPRRFGWDCHGLPIETEIEKIHKLAGSASIEEFGIARFNEECRSIVLRYTREWEQTIERIGRWIDFSNNWHTMDLTFMESVWWTFKQLQEKGLVYEGFKVMPVSPKLGTPLSNFEATSNYVEVDDPSITLQFFIEGKPNECFLAWTTTPWSLPSNVALAVNAQITYVKVKAADNRFYILAEDRLQTYFQEKEIQIVKRMIGADLVGVRYEPVFDTFKDKKFEGAFQVVRADFVSTEEGTGIVHIAPAHGEDDFYAAREHQLPLILCVDDNGKFTSEMPKFKGMFVKDADKLIIQFLKEKGNLFDQRTIHHRYPFCWRTDQPLIYKVVTTWFVAVEKIKINLLKNNDKIHWMPPHIQHGRFGKWLENARDWAVSRFRYWGTPIPIWRAEDGECLFIGSIKELENYTGQVITDLHRHFIDDLTIEKDGKKFTRIKDVFDCWFESGCMPWAQNHYPFETNDSSIPADFIAEGLDQTRGWFYTLNVLSTALFNKPSFKNVIVNGILLAEDGNKMSKRLKNYPEPREVIEEYSADAVRLYMLSSPAAYADDLRFSKKGVEITQRTILIPLMNALHFYKLYARIYHFTAKNKFIDKAIKMDRWIMSLTYKLAKEVSHALDQYDLPKAIKPFTEFVDQLTNWYIRRSRARFWSAEDSIDRESAFTTLYTVLYQLAKIAAPFTPFISERIFRELRIEEDLESVHLCDFPEHQPSKRDESLEEEMALVQEIVGLGHSLRKEVKIKVRQPLKEAIIITSNLSVLDKLKKHEVLIQDELNVKSIIFESHEEKFVRTSVQPNFRILGKKVGAKMPQVKKLLETLPKNKLKEFINNHFLIIEVDGESIQLEAEDLILKQEVLDGLSAKTDGSLTLALNTHLDESLKLEGIAREIVNKLNSIRKEMNFDVQDRIEIKIEGAEFVLKAYQSYRNYIEQETLIRQVSFEKNKGEIWDLNGYSTKIEIKKA